MKKNISNTPSTETPTQIENNSGEAKPALEIEIPLDQVSGGRQRVCRSLCPWASGVCLCWAGSTVCQSR